jgi:uncharacterized membrane protein YsdA (DUF1294 family)
MSTEAALVDFVVAALAALFGMLGAIVSTTWSSHAIKTWGFGIFVIVLIVMGIWGPR